MADYLSQFTGSEIDTRLSKVSQLETGKQDKLVSGTNIKTINGSSVLGSGDLPIQTGDPNAVLFTSQTLTDAQKEQARANIDAASLEDVTALNDAEFIVAWDGTSTPVVANIPAGVTVTYNTTTYTGTLAASASTAGNIYLVKNSSNYDMYVSTASGSSYSWVGIGSTALDLSGYATTAQVSQLDLKFVQLGGYLVPLLRKVVYKDDDAESLIAGINALLNTVEVTSISAVYTQPGTIYAGQPLDDLKANLVVTANYNDGSSVEVSTYELSGTLTAGTSSILVTYQEFTTTFNVTVTDAVHYKDGSIFPGGVSLRNSSTQANLSQAYSYNGVTYVFTNGSSTTAAKRCSYYLFDLLLTAGKTYRFTIEFDSSLTNAQSIIPSIGYYDETYRAAGVANVYAAFDYTSHLTDPGWLTSTKVDSKTVQWEHLTPEGVVGGRISIKLQSSGTDQNWPSTLNVKRLIIQEVTE